MQIAPAPNAHPLPTTSGTGTPIATAYAGNDWSWKAFLEVTGPATSGPIQHAFADKADALAAAAGLSHGTQPALAVMFDAAAGPDGSAPWVVQALQLASPFETGFEQRNGEWFQTGWRVDTQLLDLENGNLAASLQAFVAKAPFAAGVHAIVDGSVVIPATQHRD